MDLNLENKIWKEFRILDIFEVYTGAQIPKNKLQAGYLPRITATDNQNGVFDFYKKIEHKNLRDLENFISVSFLGSVFYHQYKASLDMKIHAIKTKGTKLNKYLAEFLIISIKSAVIQSSYGNQMSSGDLPNKRIYLPLDSQGNPDYAFMEEYIKCKEQEKLDRYKQFASKRLAELKNYKEVEHIEDKEWGEFEIEDVFQIKSGVRLTKADMSKGKKPFVGATDSNNGITEFTSNTNNSEDRNVLGVNYNGSVVENFYHPYTAIFSDDVKRLSFKNITGNRHLYLFAKNQILKQRVKYQYAYKFNAKRMSKQKIMLPINKEGKPDYEFMENYIKKVEYLKLQNYLSKK